jgi:GNAT superfamily N-acetyltransferase
MKDLVCWEALEADDPALADVRRLYEAALDPEERIPWAWLGGAVEGRKDWRPGQWARHLVLAGPRTRRGAGRPVGFAYGLHLPDYGGYACYLAVDPRRRRHGTGTLLLRVLVRFLQADAACEASDLPFVIWESRMPGPDALPDAWDAWRARLHLFARVGARWIAGLTLRTPNFGRRGGPPVPLQLFLLPVDRPAEAFDAAALRAAAAGLLRRVYGQGPGDLLYDETLAPGSEPVLRPALEAVPAPAPAGP